MYRSCKYPNQSRGHQEVTHYPTDFGACSPTCNYDTAIDLSWYTERAFIEIILDIKWNQHKCHQMIEIVLLKRQNLVSRRKYNVAMPQWMKNQSTLIFLAEFVCACKRMSHTWNTVLTVYPSSLTFAKTPVLYIMQLFPHKYCNPGHPAFHYIYCETDIPLLQGMRSYLSMGCY